MLSTYTQARIDAFVDWFIRSDWVSAEWSDLGSDRYLVDADRADRCDSAAEDGADGSTHREIIEDWRNGFKRFMRQRNSLHTYDRFESAVLAYFDSVEAWHTANGSIDEQIG